MVSSRHSIHNCEKSGMGSTINMDFKWMFVMTFILLNLCSLSEARKGIDDPDKWLEKFGYMAKLKPGIQHHPQTRRNAIKNFQRMYHMKVTGLLDKATRTKMAAPRCGMPDMVPPGTMQPPPDAAFEHRNGGRPSNFAVPGYKWSKNRLTWKILNSSPDFAASSQRRAFYQAFEHWNKVANIGFSEVGSSSEADIEIKFAHGEHGDGNGFDGKGGTLAHAFYPENGDSHFDEGEDWSEYSNSGTNLMIVAAHEFGHALGIGHSNVDGALMAPYYQGYDPNFKLHDDDIRAIQSLYGAKEKPTPRPTPRPRPTRPPRPGVTTRRPTPKPGAKPDECTTKFDAIFQAHDSRIYVFKYKWIWRLNSWGLDGEAKKWPILARKVYNNPPINIGAAVYSWRTRYTYFFKGNKIFKYYGFRRIERKTLKRTEFPEGVQASLIGRDGRIYLFKGAYFYLFDEYTMKVPNMRGTPIASMWPGVPPNIEAAVRLRDGYVYFFKGTKYRKFDEYYKRVLPGYPKSKAAPWMGQACGGNYVPK